MAAAGAAAAGETPDSAVIVSYGFARTTIYKWLKAGAKPGFGRKALRSRRASDRPPMGSVAKGSSRRPEATKAKPGADQPFHAPMVVLDSLIANDKTGPVRWLGSS